MGVCVNRIGKDRTFAQLRSDAHSVVQQVPEALDDREAEPKAPAPFAQDIVDLMVFLEDCLKFLVEDANSRIPDLNAQQSLARRQPTNTLPWLMYFNAFESKLRIICSSRRGSLLAAVPIGA